MSRHRTGPPAPRAARAPGLVVAALALGVLLALTGGGRSAAKAVTVPPQAVDAALQAVNADLADTGAATDPAAAAAGAEAAAPLASTTPAPATAAAPDATPNNPAAPATPKAPGTPQLSLNLKSNGKSVSQPLTLILLITVLSLAPAILIMITSFTRIVIVLGLTRNAMNLQGVPPNQVIIGLALFLSLFVMAPVLTKANTEAIQPYLKGEISQQQAYDKGIQPFREFMLKQTRQHDLALFVKLSGKATPKNDKDVPTATLIPAFVISELRTAFLIGFVIFVPFLVIDIVTSAALMSMGMVMLPPVVISLPFKLLLFVVVDGWYLVVQSLVKSFVK